MALRQLKMAFMTPNHSIGLSNVRWVGAIRLGQFAIQLASVVTLSRLLAPSDYGLMAMATTFTTFVYIIRDMGASTALVQIKLLPPDMLSTMFCFNVSLGLILGIAVVLSSHLVALGFVEPRLEFMLMALAISLPLGSLSAVHQALMERGSRFRDVARIEISSSLIGFGVALLSAWNGFGVYSLVMQTLTTAAVSTAQLWRLSPWRPIIKWDQAQFRKIWHFSANLTGFNIANYLERNADNILIGRFLGANDLGLYSMAYNIMLFPLQSLTYVINRALFPVYARQDREKMRIYYSKMLSMLALISSPLLFGLWVVRAPFVQAVLGEKWLPVAAVLTWLAPAGFLQTFLSTTGPILMATGRTDVLRNLGVFLLPLWLIAFICGLPYGIVGVAAAYFFATLLSVIPGFYYTLREIDLGISDLVASVWRPITIGLIMATVVTMVDMWLVPEHIQAWLRVAVLVPVGAVFYFASLPLLAPSLLREFKMLLWQRS
jgi:O-antigen/teichoic acid export membrane protein